MNFRRGVIREEPEINLVPMIDVLLVILIFLMVTTTYSRFSELEVNLPKADASQFQERPDPITVAVDSAGRYAINRAPVPFAGVKSFADELRRAAKGAPEPLVVVAADANATHQSVIYVMEAARLAGYNRITFTTQAER